MKPIKIGTDYKDENGKKKTYSYLDVKPEKDGWVDPTKFLPEDFDMVTLKIAGKPKITGWINGTTWVGFRLRIFDQVVAWKKEREE